MINTHEVFEKRQPTDLGSASLVAVGWKRKGRTKGREDGTVTIRCLLDGLLLFATLRPESPALLAFDGEESFGMDAVEALYYELVSATREELLGLERACYRLLRRSADFHAAEDSDAA